MSLTSRVANLFFSEPTTTRGDYNTIGFTDNGLPGGKDTLGDIRLGSGSAKPETMAPQAFEEEGRPRYLHVRNQRSGGRD